MPQPWGIMLHKIHTFECKRRLSWDVDGVAIFIFLALVKFHQKVKLKFKKNEKNEKILED
jgi:hypothetical protein